MYATPRRKTQAKAMVTTVRRLRIPVVAGAYTTSVRRFAEEGWLPLEGVFKAVGKDK